MQRELEKLMASTEADKRAWQKKESELLTKLELKDKELKLSHSTWEDAEFSRRECVRKDHVIDTMQATFTMVLQRAM